MLLLTILCAGLALGTSPASAARTAGTSQCWRDVLGDWFPDGRIDKIYPLPCYTEAEKHLPPDATQYSGARDDIQRALQQALREKRNHRTDTGSSTATTGTGTGTGPSSSSNTPGGGSGGPSDPGGVGGGGGGGGHKSALERIFDRIGPANAESIPVPLLVLGGIAILLLLTAGASFGLRRLQARRMQPPEPDPEQL